MIVRDADRPANLDPVDSENEDDTDLDRMTKLRLFENAMRFMK